jgi:hypothetical protein
MGLSFSSKGHRKKKNMQWGNLWPLSKEQGGLEISNLEIENQCLLTGPSQHFSRAIRKASKKGLAI